ncbi:MAG: malate dehydrogenase [Campylobacter sp.]|uniref:lactate/malate family dehydrogenase n=1 Tax=Campylobacter sp. TaxID=205 RepID=UPI002A751FDC|nr:malate dehydrogenase [Campylobacter sp.]MCI6579980.1 malate dehydrogenase [Campylobacter sp.]MDY3245259.1 malate dehydrogenase [Campylobacter sp.]
MKIAIIGAGNVGANAAALLIARKVAKKIALVDIAKNPTLGKALDLNHMAALLENDTKIKASDEYKIIKNADICVITAGMPRKVGQSRADLLATNASIIKYASKQIAKYAPKSVIIVVSNPLDAMTFCAHSASGFERGKVFGMAGELDSARLRFEIAQHFGLRNSECKGQIYGEHGENMSAINLGAKGQKISKNLACKLENLAKKGGARIISLLGSSAYFAPAAGIVKICEALRARNGKVLVCSALDESGYPCGRAVKFGKKIKILADICELKTAKEAIKKDCDLLKSNKY